MKARGAALVQEKPARTEEQDYDAYNLSAGKVPITEVNWHSCRYPTSITSPGDATFNWSGDSGRCKYRMWPLGLVKIHTRRL